MAGQFKTDGLRNIIWTRRGINDPNTAAAWQAVWTESIEREASHPATGLLSCNTLADIEALLNRTAGPGANWATGYLDNGVWNAGGAAAGAPDGNLRVGINNNVNGLGCPNGVNNQAEVLKWIKTHYVVGQLGEPWKTILHDRHYDLSGATQDRVEDFKRRYITGGPINPLHLTAVELENSIKTLTSNNPNVAYGGQALQPFDIAGAVVAVPLPPADEKAIKTRAILAKIGAPWQTILTAHDLSGADAARINRFVKFVNDFSKLKPFNPAAILELDQEVNYLATGNTANPAQLLAGGNAPSQVALAGTDNLKYAQTRAVAAGLGEPWADILERRNFDLSVVPAATAARLVKNFKTWVNNPAHANQLVPADLDTQIATLCSVAGIANVNDLTGAPTAQHFGVGGVAITAPDLRAIQTHAVLMQIGEPLATVLRTRNFDLSAVSAAAALPRIQVLQNWLANPASFPLTAANLNAQLVAICGAPNIGGVHDLAGGASRHFDNAVGGVAITADETARVQAHSVLLRIGEPWTGILRERNFNLSGASAAVAAGRIQAFKDWVNDPTHLPPVNGSFARDLDTQLWLLHNGAPGGGAVNDLTTNVATTQNFAVKAIAADDLVRAQTQAVLHQLGEPWASILKDRKYDLSRATPDTIRKFNEGFAGKLANFELPAGLNVAQPQLDVIDRERKIDAAIEALNSGHAVTLLSGAAGNVQPFDSTKIPSTPPSAADWKKIKTRAVLDEIGEPWKGILGKREYDLNNASDTSIKNFKNFIDNLNNIPRPITRVEENALDAAVVALNNGNATALLPNARHVNAMYFDRAHASGNSEVLTAFECARARTHIVLTTIGEPWLTILRDRNYNLSRADGASIKAFQEFIQNPANFPSPMTAAEWIALDDSVRALRNNAGAAVPRLDNAKAAPPFDTTRNDVAGVGAGAAPVTAGVNLSADQLTQVQHYAQYIVNCKQIKNLKLRAILMKDKFLSPPLEKEQIQRINDLNKDQSALRSVESFSEALNAIDSRFSWRYLRENGITDNVKWNGFVFEAKRIARCGRVPNLYIRKVLEETPAKAHNDMEIDGYINAHAAISGAHDLRALDDALGWNNVLCSTNNPAAVAPTPLAIATGLWDPTAAPANRDRARYAATEEVTLRNLSHIRLNPALRKILAEAKEVRVNYPLNPPLDEDQAKWIDQWLAHVPNLTLRELNQLLHNPINPQAVLTEARNTSLLNLAGTQSQALKLFSTQSVQTRHFPPEFTTTVPPIVNHVVAAGTASHIDKAPNVFNITPQQFAEIRTGQRVAALYNPSSTTEDRQKASHHINQTIADIGQDVAALAKGLQQNGEKEPVLSWLKDYLVHSKLGIAGGGGTGGRAVLSGVDFKDPTALAAAIAKLEGKLTRYVKSFEDDRKKIEELWIQMGSKTPTEFERTKEALKQSLMDVSMTDKDADKRIADTRAFSPEVRARLAERERELDATRAEYEDTLAMLRAISRSLETRQQEIKQEATLAEQKPITYKRERAHLIKLANGAAVIPDGDVLSVVNYYKQNPGPPVSVAASNADARLDGLPDGHSYIFQEEKNIFVRGNGGRDLVVHRAPQREDHIVQKWYGSAVDEKAYQNALHVFMAERVDEYLETARKSTAPIYLTGTSKEEVLAFYEELVKADWPEERIVNVTNFTIEKEYQAPNKKFLGFTSSGREQARREAFAEDVDKKRKKTGTLNVDALEAYGKRLDKNVGEQQEAVRSNLPTFKPGSRAGG